MRRSLLFIPANRERMLQKSDNCDADVIIFDLEDSIPESDKESGRLILNNFLTNFQNINGKEIVVRINSSETLWKPDIVLTSSNNLVSTYMIPKANVKTIKEIDEYLSWIENENSKPKGSFSLIPLIETPQGIIDVYEIAKSSSRIIGMLFGAEDYATQMNISRSVTGEEILIARSIFAIACSAAGIEAYDTPFVDINNMSGLEFDTNKGRMLGMTGKAAIHPNHITIIHKVYTPKQSEIEKAMRIVKGNEIAKQNGQGSFSVDGEMIDLPVVLRAKKLLESLGMEPS